MKHQSRAAKKKLNKYRREKLKLKVSAIKKIQIIYKNMRKVFDLVEKFPFFNLVKIETQRNTNFVDIEFIWRGRKKFLGNAGF